MKHGTGVKGDLMEIIYETIAFLIIYCMVGGVFYVHYKNKYDLEIPAGYIIWSWPVILFCSIVILLKKFSNKILGQ